MTVKPQQDLPDLLVVSLRSLTGRPLALQLADGTFDEVYQLAADMGGMGFISSTCAQSSDSVEGTVKGNIIKGISLEKENKFEF